MEDTIIKGLIVGAMLGIVGWLASLAWRVARSQSEGARRVKLVLWGCVALTVVSFLVSMFGVGGAALALGAGAVGTWVAFGFRNKP